MRVTTDVIDNKMERDKLVEQVEILDKAKELFLLPELEMSTTQQVADFYGVSIDTLKSVVKYHKDELISDGYVTLSGKQTIDLLKVKNDLKEIKAVVGKYIVTLEDNSSFSFANRSNALFPKRVILRVGMLLRNSEVAKKIRTRLLNKEGSATQSYLNGLVLYGLSFSLLLMRPLTLYTKKEGYTQK